MNKINKILQRLLVTSILEHKNAWKVSEFGVFLVSIFPRLVQIRENTDEKMPNLVTFYALNWLDM